MPSSWMGLGGGKMKRYRRTKYTCTVHRGMREMEICNSLKVFARRQEINGREIIWN